MNFQLEKQGLLQELQAARMDSETYKKMKEHENYDLLFQNQVFSFRLFKKTKYSKKKSIEINVTN